MYAGYKFGRLRRNVYGIAELTDEFATGPSVPKELQRNAGWAAGFSALADADSG